MIVVVDSGVANTGSILNMLARVGARSMASSDPNVIETAEKLVLPGVGAFDAGMRSLEERGLIEVLNRQVCERGIPILGLCLGMQLMTRCSEEGEKRGLGWIDTPTVRFRVDPTAKTRVPHMGWNVVQPLRDHPILSGLEEASRFYFVHSYHVPLDAHSAVLGVTHHGIDFASVIGRDNIIGVQFHPEKSHRFGMRLLENFVKDW